MATKEIELGNSATASGGNAAGRSTASQSTAESSETMERLVRPLAGKVALVTGASRGIGKAIATELSQAGAMVALNFRTGMEEAQALEQAITAAGGQAIAVHADVTQESDVRAMVERVRAEWGKVDILVNNSGITRDRTLRKMSTEDWLAVINTNLNSVFFCTAAVTPGMIEQNYGRIVNIASTVGQAGNYGQSNYAAAKGGIIAFTKAVALEMARYNITVNAIAPGFTATEMVMKIPENLQVQIKGRIPLGRFALPQEIAQAALFLVSRGDYITGQQINVNGGLYM